VPGVGVRHDRQMPADEMPAGLRRTGAEGTETCPGCGAVLAPVPADDTAEHPGASPSCARLFQITIAARREDVSADPGAAAVVGLADAAYDAQHPDVGDPERLCGALQRIGVSRRVDSLPLTVDPVERPLAWRTTVTDVAADLDVIDLDVLVTAWADSVREDWSALAGARGR
jgi:hypothetical protein